MALKVRKNKAVAPAGVSKKKGANQCPISRTMKLLGGAWAPHVIWYLSEQPRRFGELRIDIPAVSARVLSQRLRELEAKGVVTRSVMPTSPPSTEYALTELGRSMVPAVNAIARLGERL